MRLSQQYMTEGTPAATKIGTHSPRKRPRPRAPRSIRFSDSEWAGIETTAETRGMTAAELVRHAAVSLATRKFAANLATFPPEIAAQIERIYRRVYLLSTLKRDEMVRDGRQEKLGRIAKAASESQASVLKEVAKPGKHAL